jgi:hypothetical protein
MNAYGCNEWCDVMCKWMSKHTHTKLHPDSASPQERLLSIKLCIPLGTSFELLHLLFRWYKFCIPLGTSSELLCLLFRRYKFCIPLGMTFELLCLIFRRYLALHSLRNDFWAESLRCAPLGTTFCSFVVLCIPLGTTFELLPAFFPFFSALDGACLDFTFYILFGGFGSHGAK